MIIPLGLAKVLPCLAILAIVVLLAVPARGQPAAAPGAAIGSGDDWLDQCNVVWDHPSADYKDSMPLGNGDIGLNVWVEPNGDLIFYIAKSDAWDDISRLVKVGRVRVKLSPCPVVAKEPFRQELRLRSGQIVITAGAGDKQVVLRVWVDANRPAIHIEAAGQKEFDLSVKLELVRPRQHNVIADIGDVVAYPATDIRKDYANTGLTVEPDVLVSGQKDRVLWYHHNAKSPWEKSCKQLGLGELIGKVPDPILGRTFGGMIKGDGLASAGDGELKSSRPRKEQVFTAYVLAEYPSKPDRWIEAVGKAAAQVDAVQIEQARAAHAKWWDEFWNRTWIRISAAGPKAAEAQLLTRAYTLQRFVSACAARGAFPIKFNGSLFVIGPPEDPDARQWGGAYWFQNTRLQYWPMLTGGDYDMMMPFFNMYLRALPVAKARARTYYKHDGACFCETIQFSGLAYLYENSYLRYYFQGMLELLRMGLDYHDYTQDPQFVKACLLPLAGEILTFYDKHYGRDDKGRILFKPSAALETWQDCVNPVPEIAGLDSVLQGLSALPGDLVSKQQLEFWQRLRKELPPIPTGTSNGKKVILPAEKFADEKNMENPELYAVFPYHRFGLGKDGLEMARDTFAARKFRLDFGWCQDAIQAAHLGLAKEAAASILKRAASTGKDSRFPAFWGTTFNPVPDEDHGAAMVIALQAMLLQSDGDKILVLPAWPKDWDVQFRLHAPKQTTVTGVFAGGKMQSLTVTPASRAADVKVLEAQ